MIGRADKASSLTGTFSMDARREADRDGAPGGLVDGEKLSKCDGELGLNRKSIFEVDPYFAPFTAKRNNKAHRLPAE
ncbi:MAG: hypothetical protein R3C05_04785 [Pirellulaceae bacterium]